MKKIRAEDEYQDQFDLEKKKNRSRKRKYIEDLERPADRIRFSKKQNNRGRDRKRTRGDDWEDWAG